MFLSFQIADGAKKVPPVVGIGSARSNLISFVINFKNAEIKIPPNYIAFHK